VETPDDLPIYPIRTAAQLSGVDARRLRSWESEYHLLTPARTRGGHRLYSARDLRLIQQIRRLVDEEGMSLQGIKAWLAAPGNTEAVDRPKGPEPERPPLRAVTGHGRG
jgi:DNA-binding transcriptional MerR regulator